MTVYIDTTEEHREKLTQILATVELELNHYEIDFVGVVTDLTRC